MGRIELELEQCLDFLLDEKDLFIETGPFCRERPIEELFISLYMLEVSLSLLATELFLELFTGTN